MKGKFERIKKLVVGKEPTYKKLKVSELKVDEYQRGDLSMKKVREYAQNFDWDIFETPLVSYRDGEYWIVDGQHRIETLKLLGIDTVFCKVLTDLTYEKEADKFNKLNTARRILNANDKFHSRVESKEKDATTIRDVLSQNNLTYSKRLCKNGLDKVSAITVVENIYRDGGEKHLNRVLNILKEAWYGEPAAFGCDMMQGLSTYLRNSRGVKDGILISCLERKLPKEVIAAANFYAGENNLCISSGTNKKPHVAKVVRDLYNAEKKRLELHSII